MEGKVKKDGKWYAWKVNDYRYTTEGYFNTITMELNGNSYKIPIRVVDDNRGNFRAIAHNILNDK